MRLLGTQLVHQVDRHVVGRRERAAQRERAGGRQAGDLRRFDIRVPEHDRVSLDVDPAAAGTAGQLGVLPRRQRHMLLAVELDELLQHDRAGRHVDAQGQRFGSEYGPDQPGGEELLDGVPKGRQHAGVVGGYPAQQPLAPLVVAQHGQIGVGQIAAAVLDDLGDLGAFLLGRELQRRAEALLHGGVAAGPGEHEGDGGQQPGRVQGSDDVRAGRRPVEAWPGGPPGVAPARLPVRHAVGFAAVRDVAQEFGIDVGFFRAGAGGLADAAIVEQVEHALADQDVLPQGHRPVLVDDHCGVAADGLNPATELLGVAYRRRQADQPHLLGQVQDDFLPDRTPHPVRQEVHLIHHHVRKTL